MTTDTTAQWLQFGMELPRPGLEAAEAAFGDLGALVTWTENAGSAPVLEPAPGETPLWDRIRLTGLFPASHDPALLEIAVGQGIPGVSDCRAELVADRDWDAAWRRQLRPLRFGPRLWVCPEGQPCPDTAAVSIVLEPGMAFGTGTHATTALCLEWLSARELGDRRVLDYGCGSGILAVAALALGARSATGVDIDPQALQASRDNAARNGCSDRLDVREPGAGLADERYDILMANILSGILIQLAPVLRRHVTPGAPVALSGVLEEQAAEVCAAFRDWVSLAITGRRDGWVLLTGQVQG